MTTQPVSDQPPVYHAGYWEGGVEGIDPDDLDCLGYHVQEVTADNAERFGYGAGETGLKVRRVRTHVADVADLAEAKRAILADMERRMCLVYEPHAGAAFYEAMVRE